MADHYYKTIGQAWSAMAAAFTAADALIYNSTGFDISWTPSSASTGGYFTVAGTTYIGEPPANGTYRAADSKTGGNVPLASVLKSQGFQDIPQVTSTGVAGALGTSELRDALMHARNDAIADITGASDTDVNGTDLYVTGAPVACVYTATAGWYSDSDAMLDCFAVMDSRGQPATSPVTYPPAPTYGAIVPATITNNIDVGPQLDTDVAINNGSVIETVVAKQFTGI